MRIQRVSTCCSTNNKNAYQSNSSNQVQFKGVLSNKMGALGLAGLLLSGCEKPLAANQAEIAHLLNGHPDIVETLKMPPLGFTKLNCSINIDGSEIRSIRDFKAYVAKRLQSECRINLQQNTYSYTVRKTVFGGLSGDLKSKTNISEHYAQMQIRSRFFVSRHPEENTSDTSLTIDVYGQNRDFLKEGPKKYYNLNLLERDSAN